MGAALDGTVEEPRSVLVRRLESRAINWYNEQIKATPWLFYQLNNTNPKYTTSYK